jgi:hypothetical protein
MTCSGRNKIEAKLYTGVWSNETDSSAPEQNPKKEKE